MRCLYFFGFLLFCFSSKAQFSFGYAPSKWTTSLTPGSNGSVSTAGAPNSITITGSDGASATNMDVDYSITALASGPFSFSWSYHTNDSDADPQYDVAGVLVNGAFTQLTTNTAGLINQSGSYSASVSAGSIIGFRIRAVDNIYGNATFTISGFSPPGGVLPVKLLSFTAQKQNATVLLSWQSATETRFSHFDIERSGNDREFSTLQTVKATGGNSSYKMVDAHPAAGNNYYRLKMVDDDGTATYSKTINVNMGNPRLAFSISPNPATSQCTMHINAVTSFTETITVTNTAGATMAIEKVQLHEGSNEKLLNITALAKGIYLVRLQTSGVTMQLVKQ